MANASAKKTASKGAARKTTAAKPKTVKAVLVDSGASAVSRAEERKWKAESDLRALREAAQIQSDPVRLKAAKALAQQEIRALSRIGGRSR